jgi:hypothetical protein
MEDNKLERMAEIALQVMLDEIREHRRTSGLDPVWFPSEQWLLEHFRYILECFKNVDKPTEA